MEGGYSAKKAKICVTVFRPFSYLGSLGTVYYTNHTGSGGSGGGRGEGHPPGSKFFQFHAVFRKFWQNRMLAPLPGELAPPPREILDPPLTGESSSP